MKNKVLYRPVGINELNKIIDLDFLGFPPRLEWQPIFYPVLNFEYAEQIAQHGMLGIGTPKVMKGLVSSRALR